MTIAESLVLLLIALSLLLYRCLSPPRHPRNIPSVPVYTTLLPLLTPIDQETLYRTHLAVPLRRHGAVKIYFGARWNVLVGRADMMARVLRDAPEDTFRKSGNHEKTAGSVLAHFLGDNVISASGERWRRYRAVVKAGMNSGWDMARLRSRADELVAVIERRVKRGRAGVVAVQELFQRYTIANTADLLLHMPSEPLEEPSSLSQLQTRVKRRIFLPLFLFFPILDSLPFTGRWRDRLLVDEFSNALQRGICAGPCPDPSMPRPASLGRALVDARDAGMLTPRQFRDNVNVCFTASQENPQMALASVTYLLAKHLAVQNRLRDELLANNRHDTPLDRLPYLNAVLYECLRLYPPLNQLINRVTASPTLLAPSTETTDAIIIPGGTYVGYLCYAINRDEAVWGADASEFLPERWGATIADVAATRRRAGAAGGFVTFHGGRRACLGERYAMDVLRETLVVMLLALEWDIVPGMAYAMTPAGPLYPWDLKLLFRPIGEIERPRLASQSNGHVE